MPVEAKATAGVLPGDVRHVHTFLDEYSDMAKCGIVLYNPIEQLSPEPAVKTLHVPIPGPG